MRCVSLAVLFALLASVTSAANQDKTMDNQVAGKACGVSGLLKALAGTADTCELEARSRLSALRAEVAALSALKGALGEEAVKDTEAGTAVQAHFQAIEEKMRLAEQSLTATRGEAAALRNEAQRIAGKVDGLIETMLTHRGKSTTSTACLGTSKTGTATAAATANWDETSAGCKAHETTITCTAQGISDLTNKLKETGKQGSAAALKGKDSAHATLGSLVLIGGSGAAYGAAANSAAGCALFSSASGGASAVFDSAAGADGTWGGLWSVVSVGGSNGVNLIANGKTWENEGSKAKDMSQHPLIAGLLAKATTLVNSCNTTDRGTTGEALQKVYQAINARKAWTHNAQEETLRAWLEKRVGQTQHESNTTQRATSESQGGRQTTQDRAKSGTSRSESGKNTGTLNTPEEREKEKSTQRENGGTTGRGALQAAWSCTMAMLLTRACP
ncbi:hypothetical protein ERJ75_000611100 [Trypanosoma vivax]|nr:hypothetical protein ERJ75_000611100 [Trypanosoma vivax]